MNRLSPGLAALLGVAGLVAAAPTAALPGDAVQPTLAVIAAQDRAGDADTAAVFEQSLRSEVGRLGRLVAAGPTRDALRRLRLRNGDRTPPALMSRLAAELRADWLVSATLHEASGGAVPTVALSARVYDGSGEVVWAGFEAGSGLDERRLLGLGGTSDLAEVVRRVAARLSARIGAEPAEPLPTASALGLVALVPVAASTQERATPNAESVTEALRGELFRRGVPMVSANRCSEILRRTQEGRWGGVTADTRAELHRSAGAGTILTGGVEEYALLGSETGPAPRVAIALRVLDAATGRIVWTDWLERDESRALRPFGLGRPHAPGALVGAMAQTLIGRLERRIGPNEP